MRPHVAVPKLIRHDRVQFRPQSQHGLIAGAALISRLRFPLPAFDDGRVQVDGRDLVSAPATELLDHLAVHRAQPLERRVLLRDVTALPQAQSLLLRFLHFGVVVKLVQELARCFRGRHLVADQFPQSIVGSQLLEVFQTVAPGRVQNDEALHVGVFGQSALPLLQRDVSPDAAAYRQRPESLDQHWHSTQSGDPLLAGLIVIGEGQGLFGHAGLQTFGHELGLYATSASPPR